MLRRRCEGAIVRVTDKCLVDATSWGGVGILGLWYSVVEMGDGSRSETTLRFSLPRGTTASPSQLSAA